MDRLKREEGRLQAELFTLQQNMENEQKNQVVNSMQNQFDQQLNNLNGFKSTGVSQIERQMGVNSQSADISQPFANNMLPNLNQVANQKALSVHAPALPINLEKAPGSIDELYNNVEVNIKDKTIHILNRTIYVKEAIPRGFWNPESKTENGKPRLTIALYHDREKKDEHGADNNVDICCSEMWFKMATIQGIAQRGHRVVSIDLPGYGDSASGLRVEKPDFFTIFSQTRP